MYIEDITIDDIKQKKIWKLIEYNDDNFVKSEVKEISKINSSDIIVHSAVIVQKWKKVYPVLVAKYYEDGGEVGEYFVFKENKWWFYDMDTAIEGETEGEFLSFISTLDSHEYQKGSFDNRKFNYERFSHYVSQIDKSTIKPFEEKKTKVPNKFKKLDKEQQISFIKEQILQMKEYHKEGKVSKGNKINDQIFVLRDEVLMDSISKELLKELLYDDNKYIQRAMMYFLADEFREECLEIIKKVSEENSTDGLIARMKLEEYK